MQATWREDGYPRILIPNLFVALEKVLPSLLFNSQFAAGGSAFLYRYEY